MGAFRTVVGTTARALKAAGRFVEGLMAFPGIDLIDPQDSNFRRLSQGPKDLPAMEQDKMLSLAYYLWRGNPLARRFIEIDKDFVLGDGFTVTSDQEDIAKVLEDFWTDPINRWPLTIEQRIRDLAIDGEVCWPVFTNEITGKVRLGYLDPRSIARVEADPDNATMPLLVTTKSGADLAERKYRCVLQGKPEELLAQRGLALWGQGTDGECFYYRINSVSNATRGSSDLEPNIDHLDQFDRLHFDTADRVGFLNAFLWHVQIKGATEPALAKWRSEHAAPPKAGSVRVSSEEETWTAVNPDLKTGDVHELVRMVRLLLGAGAGIPDHWISEGQATRASAKEMNDPPFKRLKTRQAFWKSIITDVCAYALEKAREPKPGVQGPLAGVVDAEGNVTIPPPVEEAEAVVLPLRKAFTVQESPITTRDFATAATTLQTTTNATSQAVADKIMTKQEARLLLVQAATEMGVDLPPELPEIAEDPGPSPEMRKLVQDAMDQNRQPAPDEEEVPRPTNGNGKPGQNLEALTEALVMAIARQQPIINVHAPTGVAPQGGDE